MTVLVIGSTGTTGRLVAEGLARRAYEVRGTSRHPSAGEFRFDWYDTSTHEDALRGVDAVYLVPPVGEPDPAPVMSPFLERALGSGVRRAVLLSSSATDDAAEGLGLVHRRLAGSFDEWAVLRPSWFMTNFTGRHPQAISARENGEIVSATGDGRVAFVDPADIADVGVHALTDDVPHNTGHLITGPEALSYREVAEVITEFHGHPVRHRALDPAELVTWLTGAGLSVRFARILADLDTEIANGAENRTTTTVLDVTGRMPRSLKSFCAGQRPSTRPQAR
ncbi:MAG: hypothetical protein QG622_126 [Actinomycetota bacterium]|nr:hypothetical protein [Actinomycetota bacterium]